MGKSQTSRKNKTRYFIMRGGEKFGPVSEKNLMNYFRCRFQGDMIRPSKPDSEWIPAKIFLENFQKKDTQRTQYLTIKITILIVLLSSIIYLATAYMQKIIYFTNKL